MSSQIPRLVRTMRHLRASQVWWRVRYRIQRPLETRGWFGLEAKLRRCAQGAAPAPRSDLPHVPPLGVKEFGPAARLAELQAGQLTLDDLARPFKGGGDWAMAGAGREHRLWTCHLHCHEWLFDLACAAGTDAGAADLLGGMLEDWLATCGPARPGFADFPWNSYTIATRIAWWCRMYEVLPDAFWQRRRPSRETFLESLAMQAAYLRGHIEWDLRANHLMRDAVGLAWAGRFFRGGPADDWIRTAERLAVSQAREQILPDGGHFERSPMYHVQIMEDVYSLALLLRDESARAQMRRTWERMAEFLRWARHDDGLTPLFNDAAINGAVPPGEMLARGGDLGLAVDASLPPGGRHFADSGLIAWRGRPWTVFFDAGPVGADYQGGHAHADSLTMEVSCQGQRMVVDPGTFCYDNDARRRYDRSTAAHNTVCVDGADSSEVWHIFRLGRRAEPRRVEVGMSGSGILASAEHTGYDHLPGRPRHWRQVHCQDGGPLIVLDRISGTGRHALQGGYLLEPSWLVSPADGGWDIRRGPTRVRVRVAGPAALRLGVEDRPWHRGFDLETPARRLSWRLDGPLPAEVQTTFECEGGSA